MVADRTTFLSDDPSCVGSTNMGPVGWAWVTQEPNTVALYQCKLSANDYFISPDSSCEGQQFVADLGFVRVL